MYLVHLQIAKLERKQRDMEIIRRRAADRKRRKAEKMVATCSSALAWLQSNIMLPFYLYVACLLVTSTRLR